MPVQWVIINRKYHMQQHDKHIVSLSLLLKVGAAMQRWKKHAGRTKNRYYRFRELVTTEEDYFNDLNTIKNGVREPLLQAGVIRDKDALKMFANLESMIGLSTQLQEEIKQKFDKWDPRTTELGMTMIRFSKFLLVYADYFKNLNDTQKRLKDILRRSEKAKEIEKVLTTGNRIVTFQDLMSKPFQRPLKYHLILRDYASKVPKGHPDEQPLKLAIKCYTEVNERNNAALENKEKENILVALDVRFGNIIEAQARYFVEQYECIYIDAAFQLYILSDLLILSTPNNDQDHRKIYFDKHSQIEIPPDGHFFINRLFFYGTSRCVHLTFLKAADRDSVYQTISDLILDMNKNEANRQQQIVIQRTTRASVVQRRMSLTNLQPQFKRPMIIRVLGNQKRVYSSDRSQTYFVLQFTPTPAKMDSPPEPTQISLITFDSLLKLETMGKMLYPDEPALMAFPLQFKPRGLTEPEYKRYEAKRLQIQAIFIQLKLNTLYRNKKTLKRIDIFSFMLRMSQPVWYSLKDNYNISCEAYNQQGDKYANYKDYFAQRRNRCRQVFTNSKIFPSGGKATQFCDLRTIQTHQMLSQIDPYQLSQAKAHERLTWIKSNLGWINHFYTHSRPHSAKYSLTVYCPNVNIKESVEVEIYSSQRVKHILELVALRLNFYTEDYTLAAHINDQVYYLSEDEIVPEFLYPPKKEEGFFSFFKSDDYKIHLFLRKKWVLELPLELAVPQGKLRLAVEEVIYRLKCDELKLSIEETIAIYGYYYAFRHFIELDTLGLDRLRMRQEEFTRIINPALKKSHLIEEIYKVIIRLKADKTITEVKMLAERIIQIVNYKPGWSTPLYNGLLKNHPGAIDGLPVKVGCDISGITVFQNRKAHPLYGFRFGGDWTCEVNGLELIIKEAGEYRIEGANLWKVKEELSFYRLYCSSFKK